MQMLRVPRRPATGIAAALLGVLAIAVGAGIAIRWLPKAGLQPGAVAALALLVLGVVAVAAAVVGFWRTVHGVRRLWLVPAALVALVLLYAVGIGVSLTVVPPTASPAGSAPEAHRLPADDVAVRTADGVRLSAWWAPSRNRAAVVLLHGAGETRAATLPQARVLARHGYGVLLLDARGHGDSGGRGMDAGWYGDLDVAAALDFLAARPDVDPARIAVLGLSMGGEEAIGAAADGRIRAVVAEGATGRTAADKDALAPRGRCRCRAAGPGPAHLRRRGPADRRRSATAAGRRGGRGPRHPVPADHGGNDARRGGRRRGPAGRRTGPGRGLDGR